MHLSSSVSIVTGGGRGIGRVIARTLAGAGSRVALIGRTQESLTAAVAEIESAGGRAMAWPLDVTDASAVEAAVAAIEAELGPISLVVNNAGVGGGGPIHESDPAAWWRVLEVNVLGPYLVCRYTLPGMIARGRGRVVTLGSNAGIHPIPFASPYAVSKAAILRLTDCIAAEVAGTGVRAFAISPGWVWTDMTREGLEVVRRRDPEFDVQDAHVFPPEAAAALVLRIASGDADVLSGRYLHVSEDLDALLARADEIVANDLLALRLRT